VAWGLLGSLIIGGMRLFRVMDQAFTSGHWRRGNRQAQIDVAQDHRHDCAPRRRSHTPSIHDRALCSTPQIALRPAIIAMHAKNCAPNSPLSIARILRAGIPVGLGAQRDIISIAPSSTSTSATATNSRLAFCIRKFKRLQVQVGAVAAIACRCSQRGAQCAGRRRCIRQSARRTGSFQLTSNACHRIGIECRHEKSLPAPPPQAFKMGCQLNAAHAGIWISINTTSAWRRACHPMRPGHARLSTMHAGTPR